MLLQVIFFEHLVEVLVGEFAFAFLSLFYPVLGQALLHVLHDGFWDTGIGYSIET